MVSFAVFLLVAVMSIVIQFVIIFKYKIKDIAGLAGALLMAAGAALAFIFIYEPFNFYPTIVFGAGALAFIIGASRFAVLSERQKDDQSAEIQARTVSDILHVAATRESLIELLNYSLDRYLELFSLNSGAIHILHKARNILVMGSYRGLAPSRAKKLEQILPGETAIGRAVHNKRVLIIRDLRVSPDYRFLGGKAEGYSFLAVVPIIVDDDCWGVITLLGRKKYHRGMLNIGQLEQFGHKLGQALELGRENRRMTAAFSRLNNKMGFYNMLFDKVRKDWLDGDENIFKTLSKYPSSPFGGRPFCLLTVSLDKCRCVYYQGVGDYSNYIDADFDNEITAANIMSHYKADKFFKIDVEDISQLVPDNFFSNRKLVSYGYSYDDAISGILVVDESKISETQNYESDLWLISNIFNLACIRTVYQKERDKSQYIQPVDESYSVIAEELATVLAKIAENVQAVIDRLSKSSDSIDIDDFKRWLSDAEQSVFQGLGLVREFGARNNPNDIIQSMLENEKFDVAFYPGEKLPSIKSDHAEFESIVREIIKQAVEDNKRIRLKSSSENHSISLTIEGELKPRFPSEELVNKARLHNIRINTAGQNIESQTIRDPDNQTNHSRKYAALVIESNNVIADLLADLFSRIDYSCKAVSSGKEGLAFIESAKERNETIDAVVIDITLDDISGLELSKRIKEFDSGIYTIIISSWGVNLYQNTLDDAGVNAVLHKPFRLEQLTKVLPDRKQDAASNQ